MAVPVKLQAVIDEMEAQCDEMAAYINPKTGELVTLSSVSAPPSRMGGCKMSCFER